MRGGDQLSCGGAIAGGQGGGEVADAGRFADDMAGSRSHDGVVDAREVVGRTLPQWPDELLRGGAFSHALAVRGVREGALLARVDRDHVEVVGHRHGYDVERVAIDEQRVAGDT